MSEKHNIKVGQVVWLARKIARGAEVAVEGHEVVRVGRQYFYVEQYSRERKFCLQTLAEQRDFGGPVKAWLSLEDIADEQELASKLALIRQTFSGYTNAHLLTLDQVRRIHAILGEPK